jgi:hypothetical protein|tara:strand:+ start:3117 stop:3845 length:729 start_codon:yes stop_codon:yes gene_type:complete
MENNNGHIKLFRKTTNHYIASEPNHLSAWLHLLWDANWKNKELLFNNKIIEIKRGQLIFGLNAFSAKTGITVGKLRNILKNFEKSGMIDRQTTNKYSIITITKYDDYQKSTYKEQADDKQTASKQQANNKHTTTPNNTNNTNNIKNTKKGSRITDDWKPSQSLIDQIILKEKANSKWVDDHIYTFVNYWLGKTGKNATKKDWNATFKNWCANSFARPESSKHQETCADFGVEETDEIVITRF